MSQRITIGRDGAVNLNGQATRWWVIGERYGGYCAFYIGMPRQIWHDTKRAARAYLAELGDVRMANSKGEIEP